MTLVTFRIRLATLLTESSFECENSNLLLIGGGGGGRYDDGKGNL